MLLHTQKFDDMKNVVCMQDALFYTQQCGDDSVGLMFCSVCLPSRYKDKLLLIMFQFYNRTLSDTLSMVGQGSTLTDKVTQVYSIIQYNKHICAYTCTIYLPSFTILYICMYILYPITLSLIITLKSMEY
jgi:hypothetical protein